jgi:PAS domain S-box-containing protein
VSGTIGEETAVECMRLGAHDYIMKANLSRLCPAIARELKEAKARAGRKKAEDDLRESERKYRLITEKMTDIVWIADRNLRTIYVTPSVQTVLGFSQEERMNQTINQQLTPDSLSVALETLAREMVIEKEGNGNPDRIVTLILEYYHKDGSTRWMETITSPLRSDKGVGIGIHGVSKDISERKMAESQREAAIASLQKSEESYTKLVNTIPDVIVRTDLDGKIIFVNDYTLQMSGYPRQEVEGQNMLNFISPDDHSQVIQNILLMMNSKLGPKEYHMIMKDGRIVPFEVNGEILRNQDGTPFGMVNVCRDISERRQSEKLLKEKDERLRVITKNLPGVIFQLYVKDSGEYGISYLSELPDEFSTVFSKLDIPDMENVFPEFISRIHEEDRDRFLASTKNAVETVTPWNFEGRVVLQSGKMIWLHGMSTPRHFKDQLFFDGILLNITERKQAEYKSKESEEKFHKIFITTPDCIAFTRLSDGLIIDVNKGFEDILGWKREIAIGKKSTEAPINFWVNSSDRELMVAELNAGRDVLYRDFEFRRADGSIRTGIYSARTINIGGEEYIIFIMRDITEQKRMEKELLESQKTRLMGQITSGVAHEVRNPLHAIQAISEAMALDMDDKSDYKEYLMHIKSQVERLSHLMNDLLDLGKPIQPSQFGRVLLTDIAAAAVRNWKEAHPQLSQQVRVVNNLQDSDMVLVDANKIQQVIINLLENASQHSPKDEEILLTLDKSAKNYLMVKVSDRGAGLKPQDQPRIFEPFYTTRKSGTGLGLSLCKHIIESHGGTIEIVNNKNERGCSALFTIPAYKMQ